MRDNNYPLMRHLQTEANKGRREMKTYHIYDIEGEMLIKVQAADPDDALFKYLKKLAPELSREDLDIAKTEFNGYIVDDVKDLSDF